MTEFAFIAISTVAFIVDVALGLFVIHKSHSLGRVFAAIVFSSAFVDLFYTLSITSGVNEFSASMMSSLYFIGVDLTVITLFLFLIAYTGKQSNRWVRVIVSLVLAYFVFDAIVMLVNPFNEVALSYKFDPTGAFVTWIYAPKPLYLAHLAFCYVVVALSIVITVIHIVSVPPFYRGPYLFMLAGVLGVVFLNALFLYIPNTVRFDISIYFYSLVCLYTYWSVYLHSERSMLNNTHQIIMDEMGRPVVVFNFENKFSSCNVDAHSIVPENRRNSDYTIEQFARDNQLSTALSSFDSNSSFRWHREEEGKLVAYRCDFKVLTDKRGRIIGRLFIFTNDSDELDLLTRFYSHNDYLKRCDAGSFATGNTTVYAVVCDINRLRVINNRFGRDSGDRAIQILADSMREHFPEDTYFARLNEASLLAIVQSINAGELKAILDGVHEDVERVCWEDFSLSFQNAVAIVDGDEGVPEAVQRAANSLRVRKMMDQSSAHSSLLDSLAMAQRVNDGETEEHVTRTRMLGEKLGLKLGLTDEQQSNLALLSMLHDIGKVGIPLEILNKPTALHAAEWEVMKSHVDKGAEIARACPELEPIANLILHHHECWDGTGYPDGLKNVAIPLLSRIISIVDTFDAMTNDRPYRSARTVAEACSELKRCSGTQFDPFIVSEFIEMLAEEGYDVEETEVEATGAGGEKERVLSSGALHRNKSAAPEQLRLKALDYSKHIFDENGRILEINERFTQLTGYSAEDLKEYNLKHTDLLFPEDLDEYLQATAQYVQSAHEAFVEHRIMRKDGQERSVFCFGKDFFDPVTQKPRTRVYMIDVVETYTMRMVALRERDSFQHTLQLWEETARKDPLTSLLNREAYVTDVQTVLDTAEFGVLMLMVDLDWFKEFNDKYGHPAGDDLLRYVASDLKRICGSRALICRMGGDEFSVAIPILSGSEIKHREALASNVWSRLTGMLANYADSPVTVSIGAAFSEPGKSSFKSLYERTDNLLYEAKRTGRNKMVSDLR